MMKFWIDGNGKRLEVFFFNDHNDFSSTLSSVHPGGGHNVYVVCWQNVLTYRNGRPFVRWQNSLGTKIVGVKTTG